MMSALISRYGVDSVGFINGDNRLDNIVLPSGEVITKSAPRDDVCDAFNAGRLRFLISTEAGGEGTASIDHRAERKLEAAQIGESVPHHFRETARSGTLTK